MKSSNNILIYYVWKQLVKSCVVIMKIKIISQYVMNIMKNGRKALVMKILKAMKWMCKIMICVYVCIGVCKINVMKKVITMKLMAWS